MAALEVVTIPDVSPRQLLGLETHLLEAVLTRPVRPVLAIYQMSGSAVSLGRYHLYGGPGARGGVDAWRRLTGGRVVGSGEGWVGIALVLPHRATLLPERDAHLRPEQVINRYVRGLLAAFGKLGLKAFYPGRDAVTIERGEVAMCSFEIDASGAMLFEAAVAVARGMEELVHDLERFDPEGSLPCAMYGPGNAATIAGELGRAVTFAELADAIASGYADLLGEVSSRPLSAREAAQADRRGAALERRGWLNGVAPDPQLTVRSRLATQLGAIEAHIMLGPGRTIERLRLSGDFIANSAGIAEFEKAMQGKPLDFPSVSSAVMKIFASGDNFILGIGELPNLVKLLMRAQ